MTVKRTFSLPEDVSGELDRQAGGNASAFVAAAVREKAARDRLWGRFLELNDGPPDPDAYAYWQQRLTPTSATSSASASSSS